MRSSGSRGGNFSSGSFEEADRINGEHVREVILSRGGEGGPGKPCVNGCVIQCSNVFPDSGGKKIVASIHNARESERIQQEYGGFPQWLDSLDKANNYAGVVKRVTQRFKHVGVTAAPLWLYSVNEPVDLKDIVEARWGKDVPG